MRIFISLILVALISACGHVRPTQTGALHNGIPSSVSCSADTTLLLLHGWAGSAALWEETLLNVQGEIEVVALDLKGFGDRRDATGYFDYHTLVQDVGEKLDGFDECTRFVIAGHSLGGIIAQDLLAQTPDKVLGLILVSAQDRTVKIEIPQSSLSTVAGIIDADSRSQIISQLFPRYFNTMGIQDEVFRFARDEALKANPKALRESFLSLPLLQPLQPEKLTENRLPVLVVHGQNDIVSAEASRSLAAQFKNGCEIAVPNARHMLFLEAKETWIDLVNAFLENAITENASSNWCDLLSIDFSE